MNSIDRFEKIYKQSPTAIQFCPYRVCPIGAHVDHQLGKITGFAIDKGIHIAYKPKLNGVVELTSLNFDKRAQFHINSVPAKKKNDWADHLRGATLVLGKKHPLAVGICAVIEGSLPIGGLSSSASVIICFILALCKVNEITLSQSELIATALEAENKYVGVACGKLDQSCEIYSKKNHLLYLDTKDDSYELIPTSFKMKPYKIAIFFSGIERSLASSKFNMRVDECKSAAYAIQAFAGLEYGKFDETFLRDIPVQLFEKYKHKLPQNWQDRASHFYSEVARVEKAAQAWKDGDIELFGKLSFESGNSSIYNYKTGSEELQTLYEIMTKTDGIYGGRFSGAGFKGCCMALIDPSFEEKILEKVEREYTKVFPHLKEKYTSAVCVSVDGVAL